MSTEKNVSAVEQAEGDVHGISTAPTAHYPIVAEGSGKTAGNEGAKERIVHNAELYAAIQESKIEQWSRESIHLYFCVFVAFCCACANGYDGSLMGSIIAMPHFQSTFGTGYDGHDVSVITSLYNVGSIVCSPVSAILSDKLGRRMCMFTGGWVIIIGAIIASTSNTLAQLTVGRFVLGAGIQIMVVAAPAYSIEIAPPHWRGRCTGFYNCGWFGGSIPAAFVTYGCQFIDSNYSWRIPLILQCFTCLLVIVAVWFIPESPRYMMANGREEEAIAFLVKYHGNGDENSRLVQLEVQEMRENITQDGIDKRSWDYRPLFLSHNGRWRMAQVLMISIFGQFSGNGLGYFNPTIFKNIGVTSVAQQLGYNILNSVLSAIGALTAVSLTDTMPRRQVLVIGTFVCALCLACNSGLSAGIAVRSSPDPTDSTKTVINPDGTSYAQGALATYFLFNTIYSFTYTPLQGVIPAEALETTMRAKGLALSGFLVGLIGFINTFAGPIALANIGYKYIYIFVGWDIVEAFLWWLFCVESQGRTLEQLEWVYSQPHPVRASLKVDKVVVQADGHVSEKIVTESI